MIGFQNIPTAYFYTGKGQLSIYGRKSFSRSPIILGVPIKCDLTNYGGFSMSLIGKDFFFESLAARRNLRDGFGIGFSPFIGPEFFHGRFMDDICLEELTEAISTYIVGGDLILLNRTRKASFIGNLKIIDGIVCFYSTFTLSNPEFLISKSTGQTTWKDCNVIELEIVSQLVGSQVQ